MYQASRGACPPGCFEIPLADPLKYLILGATAFSISAIFRSNEFGNF